MSNDKSKTADDLIGQLCNDLDTTGAASKKCGTFCAFRHIAPWIIICFAYALIAIKYWGLRHDFDEVMYNPIFVFDMGLAFAIFIVAAIASSYFTLPDQGQKTWIKTIPMTLVSVFLFWSLTKAHAQGFDWPSIQYGVRCVEKGMYMEILPIISIMALCTRGHTTQPYWLISMNVLAVVAIGWIILRLTCSIDDAAHNFIYQILPFAIIGAGLGFFARKLFRW